MRRHVGIAGMGIYLPDNYWDAKKLSDVSGLPEEAVIEKIGVRQKPMPGPGDTTSHMGIMAARAAIQDAGIDPKEIDLVIWDGAQHKDYPCWLAFAKVAHEIGAVNAWGFDMESMCGSRIVGFELGKSLIISRDDVNTVLLVSGYRNCDLINHQYTETAFLLDIGAGGSAVILKKDYGYNEVLSTAAVADGSFSEDFIVPVGGSKKWPVAPEDLDKMWFHLVGDPKDFKERLGKVTMKNWYHVIDYSLKLAGCTRSDIAYLAMVKVKRSAHQAILQELNLREDQSLFLEDYGHVGQNDVMISLVDGLKDSRVKDGDFVLLVSAGGGWTWNAAVVRWGKVHN